MNIGEPQKTRTIESPPVPVRIPARPFRRPAQPFKVPEKVPVRVPTPTKAPDKQLWGRIGMRVSEITYACPTCGREVEVENGVVYCPDHGVIYND